MIIVNMHLDSCPIIQVRISQKVNSVDPDVASSSVTNSFKFSLPFENTEGVLLFYINVKSSSCLFDPLSN